MFSAELSTPANGSARERLRGERAVFAAAEAYDLAVSQLPVVVHGHRRLAPVGDRPERPVDEEVDVVFAGRVAVRRERRDLDAGVDVVEEAGDAWLAGSWSVPWRRVAGDLGGPVDVVGDALEDRVDVSAADGVVDLLDDLDVVLLAHRGAPLCGGDQWVLVTSSGSLPSPGRGGLDLGCERDDRRLAVRWAGELDRAREAVGVEASRDRSGGLADVVPGRRVADVRAALVEGAKRARGARDLRAGWRRGGDRRHHQVVLVKHGVEALGHGGLSLDTAPQSASAQPPTDRRHLPCASFEAARRGRAHRRGCRRPTGE